MLFHAQRPTLRRVVALATAVAASTAVLTPAPEAAASTSSMAAATRTGALPFDLPSTSALRSSPRKAFANWVPSLPISLDNKAPTEDYYQRNYLSPYGENSKHAAYGGFLRDRPLGRAPIAASDWRLQDMKTEVRSAIAEGIDGFTVVLYNFPATGKTNAQWTNIKLMMQAAAAVDPGFKIIPMPDMTSSLRYTDVATMARRMAELGRHSAAYKINGSMVLSPFTAERKSASWWGSVKSTMKNTHGMPVAFWPLFQNEQTWASSFASISYGMANWGYRDPVWNNPNSAGGPVGRMNKIQSMGKKWMQPISVQDERPREGRYFEAANTSNLRNSWEITRKGGADWTQLVTWNDLPEGSGMLPSAKHGFSFLDINAYYLTWWKTGVAPAIKRDAIYLTHRKHKLAAKTTYQQRLYMTNHDGGTPARDTVEALTFSRAAGTVRIVVGSTTHSCAVDAGVDTCTVPLGTGTVSAKLVRSGSVVSSLTSPFKVTSTPYVQDFEYVGSSSLRQGSTATTTTTTTTAPAPAPTTVTKSVTAMADSFVSAATPTKNHGGGPSVLADGTPKTNAYLRFALPAAPAGTTLKSASLRVRTTTESLAGSPSSFSVNLAGNSWTEKGMVWNTRPALSTALGSLTAPTPGTAYSSALSSAALQPKLGTQVTVAISGTSSNGIFLGSREQSDPARRPQLVLNYG